MNILLLGNGFDIANYLPTKYSNFLHVVKCLRDCDYVKFSSVGDIMEFVELNEEDSFIGECYDKHRSAYDGLATDVAEMDELQQFAKRNWWFRYLLKSLDKDVGWIDFEKEIAVVIRCFESFFFEVDEDIFYRNSISDELTLYVIDNFDFFYEKTEGKVSEYGRVLRATYRIKDEYMCNYPPGSEIKKIDSKKIIGFLHEQLCDLSKALKLYLSIFSDRVIEYYKGEAGCDFGSVLENTDYAVSVNYTNTFEKQYPMTTTYHIHGNINDNIVLGINPDRSDTKENVNTEFIAFKKYYQRTFYSTDIDYLRRIRSILDGEYEKYNIHLIVMGHSLDVTDENIIEELFSISSEIIVLYHNEEAKAQYIRNLVKIFGMDEFLKIRNKKKLEFLPLEMDFTLLAEKRANNSSVLLKKRIDGLL